MSNESPNGPGAVIGVVGATGQQGGATVNALLQAGARVRALVRNVDSPPAHRLASSGVELARADLNRPDGLAAALSGVDALFVMTTFTGPAGVEGEVAQGRAIGDAAQAAGVSRVVYSSVGGAERNTGIPHFESKRRVEEHLEALIPESIFIRPTFFMDNFSGFSKPAMERGMVVVRLPLPAGIALQMVAVRDIGRAAARALLSPDGLPNGAVEIAGEEATGAQIAATFGDAAGFPARYEPLPIETLADNADLQAMFSWLARPPAYRADIEASRDLVPELLDLRGWLALR